MIRVLRSPSSARSLPRGSAPERVALPGSAAGTGPPTAITFAKEAAAMPCHARGGRPLAKTATGSHSQEAARRPGSGPATEAARAASSFGAGGKR